MLGTASEIASVAAERIGEHFRLSRVFYAEYVGTVMKVERDFTNRSHRSLLQRLHPLRRPATGATGARVCGAKRVSPRFRGAAPSQGLLASHDRLVTELEYRTQLAVDATAALAALGSDGKGFDMVFSDVVMPGMSGIDLGREIHRRFPDLPVVLASGFSSVLAEQNTHEFKLLHKPYSINELARILARVSGAERA